MKEKLNTIKVNIHNLISLWQKAATPFEGCYQSDDFSYCYVKNSEWPNRLWFPQELTEKTIQAAIKQVHSTSKNLVIPYWDIYNSTSYKILESAGFKEKTVQIGMSLKLQERLEKHLRLKFEKIYKANLATSWADVFPKAFGYRISEEVLIKSHNDIEFYLASYLGEPVGTAIVYQTNDIVGIHGIGIIPEMRRQGFAEEIMEFVLNRAVCLNASYVTLQSSSMGKGLYDKLGFKEDFTIKNYILNQDY
jgi:ribosomal protein S18 acetylase RimI-like enzyme